MYFVLTTATVAQRYVFSDSDVQKKLQERRSAPAESLRLNGGGKLQAHTRFL